MLPRKKNPIHWKVEIFTNGKYCTYGSKIIFDGGQKQRKSKMDAVTYFCKKKTVRIYNVGENGRGKPVFSDYVKSETMRPLSLGCYFTTLQLSK